MHHHQLYHYTLMQHEKLSQLIFDSIYDKLNTQKVFTRYGLDEQERKFIKELIHPSDEVLVSMHDCAIHNYDGDTKTGKGTVLLV